MDSKQVIENYKNRLLASVKKLPKVMGNEAVNFSLDRWKEQGWLDQSFQPWQPRKKETRKTTGRAILVGQGRARLRGSIRVISISDNKVTVGTTGVPYARIHNYGGTITRHARSETFLRNRLTRGVNKGRFKKGVKAGKGFSFKAGNITMPQRKFLGRSQALIFRLVTIGKYHLANAIK